MMRVNGPPVGANGSVRPSPGRAGPVPTPGRTPRDRAHAVLRALAQNTAAARDGVPLPSAVPHAAPAAPSALPLLTPTAATARLLGLVSPLETDAYARAVALWLKGGVSRHDIVVQLVAMRTAWAGAVASAASPGARSAAAARLSACEALLGRTVRNPQADVQTALEQLRALECCSAPWGAAVLAPVTAAFARWAQTPAEADAPGAQALRMQQAGAMLEEGLRGMRAHPMLRVAGDIEAILEQTHHPLSMRAKQMGALIVDADWQGPSLAPEKHVAFHLARDMAGAVALSSHWRAAAGPVSGQRCAVWAACGVSLPQLAQRASAIVELRDLAAGKSPSDAARKPCPVAMRGSILCGTPIAPRTSGDVYSVRFARAVAALNFLPVRHPESRAYHPIAALDLDTLRLALLQGASLLEAVGRLTLLPDLPPATFDAPPSNTQALADVPAFVRAALARVVPDGRAALAKSHAGRVLSMIDDVQAVAARLCTARSIAYDASDARAFETECFDRLVRTMPPRTLRAWDAIATRTTEWVCGHPALRDSAAAQAEVGRRLAQQLRSTGMRPWHGQARRHAALMDQLVECPLYDPLPSVLCLLQIPSACGAHAVSKVNLLRDVWVALGPLAPAYRQINAFYERDIQPRTGRDAAGAAPATSALQVLAESRATRRRPRQASGVLNWQQPRPAALPVHMLLPSVLPSHEKRIDVRTPFVAERLRQGAVVATGPSGTANLLLGMTSALFAGAQAPAARDVLLGAAAFLVHDGGHTLGEVLWVADHAQQGRYSLHRPGSDAPAGSYAEFAQAFADDPIVLGALTDSVISLGAAAARGAFGPMGMPPFS